MIIEEVRNMYQEPEVYYLTKYIRIVQALQY